MIDNLKSTAAVASLDDHRRSRDQAGASAPDDTTVPAAAAPQSDVRLVIEKSKTSEVYVYTLIDRVSGRVLTSIPRHDVEVMADAPDYAAGALVSTKA